MTSMQSGDAEEPRQPMTDGVPQQGTAELSGVGICTPEHHHHHHQTPWDQRPLVSTARFTRILHPALATASPANE